MRVGVAAVPLAALAGCGGQSTEDRLKQRVEKQVEGRYERIYPDGEPEADCTNLQSRWSCNITYVDHKSSSEYGGPLKGTVHDCVVRADAEGHVTYIEEC